MRLFDIFKKKPKPLQLTGFVYEAWEHTGWGDNMYFSQWGPDESDRRRITGWLYRKPRVGDEVRFKSKEGKIMRFAVTEVEHAQGVHDMFFAYMTDIGYLGDEADPSVIEAEEQVIEKDTKETFKFL
jgi:hypothetical protein